MVVAPRLREVAGDDYLVREQYPLRLEQRVVERAESGQKRRQDDDGDAHTGDRPIGPGHQLPVL
jgi:hypothetical protein